MKSYVMLSESTLYLGVIYLSCFDNFNYADMNNIYHLSSVKKQLDSLSGYRYYIAFIVSRSHWSSLIIDSTKKCLYHYCSGGNSPHHYPSKDKVNIYSTSNGFSTSTGVKVNRSVAPKYAMFRGFKNYSIYVNQEGSQLVDGECGMFASMFLILFCINGINSRDDVKKIYTSFAFIGDKTVGMFRDMFFWRKSKQSIETQMLPTDTIKEWEKLLMEEIEISSKLSESIVRDYRSIKQCSNSKLEV